MTIGSLFSGIGGLELGLEQAGWGPVLWQAERDPFALSVLARHWPDARRYADVRDVDATAAPVDIVCGGFPCQDLSTANVRARVGLAGARSGLWAEFARVVGVLRPRFVVVENVAGPWREWLPVVRGDLWRLGYPSVPLHLSTADVGAPHHRERIFVVADADPEGESLRALDAEVARVCADAGRSRGPWRHPFAGPVRLAHGVSPGMGAVRAYGNAVAPTLAEALGRALLTTARRGAA